MSEWRAKRFWKEVSVVAVADGYGIALDDKPLRSPHKTPVIVPNRAMADAVAAEWSVQQGVIDPAAMPLTRMVNSALDKVANQRADVIGYLAGYGETDLLCYRAERPEGLVERQAQAWDPVLDWADRTLAVRLRVVQGVMPVAQPPEALSRLAMALEHHDDFALTGLHDLVSLSGSLVLALAVAQGHLDAETAWRVSRIDEDWQSEQWGADEEASEAAERKREAFLDAWRCFCLSFGRSG